jgi:molybdopterin synthase sulfur carrier subunit
VPVNILIPGPLRSYTGQLSTVQAEGGTLAELLDALDTRFPGLRFRIIDEQDQIREHIKVFVNAVQRREIGSSVEDGSEVHIICALSGG